MQSAGIHNLTGTKRRIRFDAVDDKENRQERENNKKNRVSGDFVYKSTAAVRATGKDPPRVELKKQTQSERRLKAVAYYNEARAKGKSVASSREFASQQTGYATKYVRNLVKKARTQGLDEACHDRRPGSGAPSKMSPAKQKILEDFSEENGGMFTNADAAVALAKKGKHVVKETIRRFIVAYWIIAMPRITPFLTKENAAERLAWATKHEHYEWNDRVDIDEKWFYADTKVRRKLKVPHRKKLKGKAGNKRHVNKVMYLIATAKPRPDKGFDGKIGCWRVSMQKVAQKKVYKTNRKFDKDGKENEVLREKGEIYEEDTTMDSEQYQKMFKEKVIPAIRQKMPWARRIVVQHDGASPHTGKNTEDILRESGKQSKESWLQRWCVRTSQRDVPINVERQPPNSPDMNVLDLCFNRALACKCAKERPRTKAEIVAAVEKAWREYESEKLTRAWEYKTIVLKAIIQANGWNNYKMPHRRDLDSNNNLKTVPEDIVYGTGDGSGTTNSSDDGAIGEEE